MHVLIVEDRKSLALMLKRRRLRAQGKLVPTLALTARDTVADVVATLDAGVDDYLTKPFAMAELLARLRAVVRRHNPQAELNLTVADLVLDSVKGEVSRAGAPITLTRKEFLLLEFLMRRPNRPITRESILERVWGHGSEIEPNTLDVFISNLRSKIEVGHAHRLLHTVRGIGYKLQGGQAP